MGVQKINLKKSNKLLNILRLKRTDLEYFNLKGGIKETNKYPFL